jgi:transposase
MIYQLFCQKTMPYINPEDRHQLRMVSYEDSVAAGSYVRLIDLIVDKVVQENPEECKRYEVLAAGPQTYRTETLLKLFIYGYYNLIKSSRKLENETYRNNELIWLLGNLHPDHWTIATFRRKFGKLIMYATKLFKKFLRHNDYIDLEKVAVDGSKFKANAKREFLTLKHCEKSIEECDKKIAEYLELLKRNDKVEDKLDEEGYSQDMILRELDMLNKIEELETANAILQDYKRKMEEQGISKISTTDEEASFMKTRDGLQPAFNVQTAVDSKHKMIVSSHVTLEANDLHELLPMIEAIKEEYGEVPGIVLADTGYYAPDDIEKIEKMKADVYVPVPDLKSKKDEFTYDKDNDEYICPMGKKLKSDGKLYKQNSSFVFRYYCYDCKECIKKDKCLQKNAKRRVIKRYHNEYYRDSYKKKMLEERSKKHIRKRKTIVEHPFGTIKIWMGKVPLLLRGLKKVMTEVNLFTTVYNLKRLINVEKMDTIIEKVNNFGWQF